MAREAKDRHQINEERRWVELPPVLARGIVSRKHVVVVVVALAARGERNTEVLGRVDASVVWFVSPQMCHAVDRPRYVQDGNVAQDGTREERSPRSLVPVVDWNNGRKDETHQHQRRYVQPIYTSSSYFHSITSK